MFKRLLPREKGFFNFFEQHSLLSTEACKELDGIAANPADLIAIANRIKTIEHKADNVTRECIGALHRTFITPIDRADIHRLIRRLDDIIDSVDSIAARMVLYELTSMRAELKQFTGVLVTATAGVSGAISHLRKLSKAGDIIEKSCADIYQAEKEGDKVLRIALANLFKEEKDPILIVKWKDIFERLETATDRCQEVANIIQGIVIEAS